MDLKGKKLVIATMHGKEQVISPVFEKELGVKCQVVDGLNTDEFGTFSGEKIRLSDAEDTARMKCQRAMDLLEGDLFVASEGSFGPHPELFFTALAEEVLFFTMPSAGLEIVAKHLSLNTNFGQLETNDYEEACQFASKHLFPSHQLILSAASGDGRIYRKNIGDFNELKSAFEFLQLNDSLVRVETDMRAMNNPTRMNEIGLAALKLLERIQSECPSCRYPGFGISDSVIGLPCGICGFPTNSILKYKCECQKCQYTLFFEPDHKRKFEDPTYCQVCNP